MRVFESEKGFLNLKKVAISLVLLAFFLFGCTQAPQSSQPSPIATPSAVGTSSVTASPAPTLAFFDERGLANSWNTPQKLPAPINLDETATGWLDQPWISPDGNKLYFVYYDCEGKGPKRQGSQGFFDIYFSEKQKDGSWSNPIALPPHVNSQINEAAAVESFDGTQLLFTTQDLQAAMNGQMRRVLMAARKNADGTWGQPASLGEKINAQGKQQDTPSLTADGKTLFFMRNDVAPSGVEPDTGMHVYFSTREDASCDECWSEPQMLPAPITGEREIQPMIRPDGKTLYFSRVLADGKLALHVSHKNDGGTWTVPEPLLGLRDSSPSLMGEGAASMTADGKAIYFARAYLIEGVIPTSPCGLKWEIYSATRKND